MTLPYSPVTSSRSRISSPMATHCTMPLCPCKRNSTMAAPKRNESRLSARNSPTMTPLTPTVLYSLTITFSPARAAWDERASANTKASISATPPQSASSSSLPRTATALSQFASFPKPTERTRTSCLNSSKWFRKEVRQI